MQDDLKMINLGLPEEFCPFLLSFSFYIVSIDPSFVRLRGIEHSKPNYRICSIPMVYNKNDGL